MIQKVRVYTTVGPDLKGEGVLNDIKSLGIKFVTKVLVIKVYRLEGISHKDTKILAEKLLSESITQGYTINKSVVGKEAVVLEIAYRGGVMNPEIASILKAADDLGTKLLACDTSYEYVFFGKLIKSDAVRIVDKLKLYNKLTEHIVDKEVQTLIIKGKTGRTQTILIRKMNDYELMELSKDKLFLNLEEMLTIQKYFQTINRDPTDAELETLAQTWSEHSGHKTFKSELIVDGKKKAPLITRIKKEALKHKKNIVSAFVDNSGVADFYDGWAICGKVETHNSPSAIEPYGGAMTGSGGVFRDIAATGQGAKNIASTDIFCFAPVDLPQKDLPQGSLHPEYLLKKVISGVRDYGNRMGIPTNNGSVHFHKDFRAKPTVIVGAYGIVPKKYAKIGRPKLNDLIICVGGKTGRDGIHGATFSSAEMTDRTINVNSSAVQIGNAIEEKRVFDALEEARDQGLIRMVQDCGGGGLSSAIGEIGKKLGVSVDIKNVPSKYQGLAPWEIWMSESQERMIVVLNKNNLKKFKNICKKYNAEVSILGKFDGSKKLRVTFDKEKVCNLEMEFLHHGLPKKILVAKKPNYFSNEVRNYHKNINNFKEGSRFARTISSPRTKKQWISALEKVLAHGNICSKEPIVRMYDHSVQGTNELQPYSGVELDGPNDAVVLRPFLDKSYGVVISHGLNPVLNKIDPYWGSIWACVEALSNYVAVGGDYKNASLINNYIWPFPDEESLWSLDKSVTAVCDFMKTFQLPVISGKDSLSSTYRGKDGFVLKIPPVLCMSVFGKIPDTTKTSSSDFKKVGSVICLIGKMDDQLGGSIYYDVKGLLGNSVPKVDLKLLPKIFSTIYKSINSGKALAVHDISEGGLINAVFEMCVGGNMGTTVNVPKSTKEDNFLFNETAGCFVIEVESEKVAQKIFKNVPYEVIGKTMEGNILEVSNGRKKLFEVEVDRLKRIWQEPMRRVFD